MRAPGGLRLWLVSLAVAVELLRVAVVDVAADVFSLGGVVVVVVVVAAVPVKELGPKSL